MEYLKSLLTKKNYFLIFMHYFISQIPFIGIVSTLAIILTKRNLDPSQIAIVIFLFTSSYRALKVIIAPYLDQLAAEKGIVIGCLFAAFGFLSFAISDNYYLIILSLLLTGLGISINSISSKVFTIESSEKADNKSEIFSIIITSVNIAGAIAQPFALNMLDRNYEKTILVSYAIFYIIPIIIFCYLFKKKDISVSSKKTAPLSTGFHTYLHFLKNKSFLLFVLINILIWSLYGQLYNAFSLHIGVKLNNKMLLGNYYVAMSVLIIAFQLIITNLTHKIDKGDPTKNLYRSAIAFAISFILIYFNSINILFVIAIIITFSLAEILFGPSLEVFAIQVCGHENRNVWISLVTISTALGESLGGGLGIKIYSLFGNYNTYWLYVAIYSFLVALFIFCVRYFIGSVPSIQTKNNNPLELAFDKIGNKEN
ncbi:MFS transporter [Fluviispira vulneris]|uniref:MFS transporter n=1 Tax=Fluviispira vulneris TaxID=2763012 RepID=UPI001645EC10|nr:MFS transporter [Fluviispira vulneris]